MRTVQGVSRALVTSPRACVFTTLSLFTILSLVSGILVHGHILAKYAVGLLAVFLALFACCTPDWAICIIEKLNSQVVWRIPTRRLAAALTIDDVPMPNEPEHFEEILDILAFHRVKATFFIMSAFDLEPEEGGPDPVQREKCRELLKRALDEGHELGNHLQFNWPGVALQDEEFEHAFVHCDEVLADLVGEKAWRKRPFRWFRPASGMWTSKMLKLARAKGYTTVLGNCFPYDHCSLMRRLHPYYYHARVRPGCIMVMHDRSYSPETLAEALPRIESKGIQLMTLSELRDVASDDGVQFSSKGGDSQQMTDLNV